MIAPRPLHAAALALVLPLLGCPDPGPSGPGAGEAPVASTTVAVPTSEAANADPLAGGIFTRDEVLEVFRAEHVAGADPSPATEAARRRVLAKHRLIDDEGREVSARVRAYERAVQVLAEDAESWSAFVESLDGPSGEPTGQ